MKSFSALVHREFLEHKGAFFIAPMLIIALMFTVLALAYVTGRMEVEDYGLIGALPLRIFEVGFITLAFGWWLYLLGGVVFYAADSFWADRRNNAMLFWKSMPQTDFKVLMSKLATATVLIPGLIFAAMLLSGVFAYVLVLIMAGTTGGNVGFFIGAAAWSYLNIAVSLLLVLAATTLWYLPFIAWVGGHAVAVGRWSIPLSILIPMTAVLIENVFFRASGPDGGYIWNYLAYRLEFPNLEEGYSHDWFLSTRAFDAQAFAVDLILRIDWTQVAIGAVFAFVAVYLAAEYRRRTIDN
jgi:ABC-2 type transport system permease protein